jgi:hypothetical protein
VKNLLWTLVLIATTVGFVKKDFGVLADIFNG